MEISEITFYLSLAVMAGVLQEQLILLLLLRILRRKFFFAISAVRTLRQGFWYGKSTNKRCAFCEYNHLQKDLRNEKMFLLFHN